MPHEIETMFSAVETPWHRLGNVTEGALNSAEAIKMAGLDWTVSLRGIATFGQGQGQDDDRIIPINDTFATVRDSDESVLGVVGKRYEPIQNSQCFDFLDRVLPDFDAKYETAGSLYDGRIVWMLLNLGQDVVVGEDKIVPYLLLTNSHDGSTAIKAMTTPVRVVCANTLALAVNNFHSSFSFRHTKNVENRIEEARNSLELSYKYVDGFGEEVEKLIDQQVTTDKFNEMIDLLMPLPELADDNANIQHYSTINSQRAVMLNNFENPEFAEHKNTAWSVINAISNYEQWIAPVRGQGRDLRIMERTVKGTQSPMTNQAHRMLIADRY